MPRTLPLLVLLTACGVSSTGHRAPPRALWPDAVDEVLAQARADGADTVIFFALPGRAMSDRMEEFVLRDPEVMIAMDRNGFCSARVDGFARADLYREWIGGGEGTGIAIVDAQGRCWAARPGPQDPGELAALLANAAAARPTIARARAALGERPDDPAALYALGEILLELGCRVESATLLRAAAAGGVVEARHRLARLYALDGNIAEAEEWLTGAPVTPQTRVTVGYVLYKKRRYRDAARVLDEALELKGLGVDAQRARLYLGKALAHGGRDGDAHEVFTALAAESTGSVFEAAARHALAHFDGERFVAADRPHRH